MRTVMTRLLGRRGRICISLVRRVNFGMGGKDSVRALQDDASEMVARGYETSLEREGEGLRFALGSPFVRNPADGRYIPSSRR